MILRFLYQLLLHLKPEAWREEMARTFEDAQDAAWEQGWRSYFAFGLRELGGLLRRTGGRDAAPSAVSRRSWTLGIGVAGLFAGLAAGWLVLQFVPITYTSTAMVRTVPSVFPPRLAPTPAELSVDSLMRSVLPALLSRNMLVNLIHTYDLYLPELERLPMEDAIELMQKRIKFDAVGSNALTISFSDPDRYRAQKVTRDLMSHIIDQTIRERSSASKQVVDFFKESIESAARDWDDLAQEARALGGAHDRLQLDRDLARRRYETLKGQLNEAEMVMVLETRKQGPTLEVLDLPTLPERTDGFFGLDEELFVAVCGLTGLATALVARWLFGIRLAPPAAAAILRA